MNIFEILKKKSDDAAIVNFVNEAFNDFDDYSKQIREREWWRNILYYIGEQWLEYVRSSASFRRRRLPNFIPTPVSNEIRSYIASIKSILLNQKLIPKIFPNTDELEDWDAAKIGEKLLVWMDTINDNEIAEEKEKCVIWTGLCGTGFLRTYPEMDGGEWFITKNGDLLKTGEVITENIIPFNIKVDKFGDSLRKKRWVGIQSLKPKEWVEDTFKIKISNVDEMRMIDYEKKLMQLVGQVSPWKGHNIETPMMSTKDDDLILFKEIEFKPTINEPNGKYIVVCGGKVLININRLPIKTEKGKWHYTLTDFHFNYVPGRFWSDSGVNDLISGQNAVNEIDQALAINRKGMGRPKIITPGEIGLKKVNEGDQGFIILSYDPLMSNGLPPTFHPGIPLPVQVLEERRIHKEQIQDLSGDPRNILRGKSPSTRSSGIQLDILRETAEQGHYPDTDRYNRGMNKVYKKRLLLAKEIFTEERTIKIIGKGGDVNINKFKSSDLRNNTDVKLELDSGMAKTKAGQTQLIMDLNDKGFFGDLTTNFEVRQQILRRLGMSGINEQVNVDYERAQMENSIIASGNFSNIFIVENANDSDSKVLNDDPLFKYDNHFVHYEVIRKFILSSEFKALSTEIQNVAIGHADIHHTMMMAEIQMQEQKMLMTQGEGGPGAGTIPPPVTGGPPPSPV